MRKSKEGVPLVDWNARDESLSKSIHEKANELRRVLPAGRKLTINMIARAVGIQAWASTRLLKFPKSRAALIQEVSMK